MRRHTLCIKIKNTRNDTLIVSFLSSVYSWNSWNIFASRYIFFNFAFCFFEVNASFQFSPIPWPTFTRMLEKDFLPTNHTVLSSTTIDFLIETKGKMKIIVAWKSNEFLSLVFRIPLCYWNIVIDVTIAGSRFAGSIIDLTVFLMNAVLSPCSVSRSGDKCVITKNKWFSTKRCSFETN